MKTAQDEGRVFEKQFAESLGTKPQKGSGNIWTARLDVADGAILWSCKWTGDQSFRLSMSLMKEAQDAITGQGGMGGSTIPGVATCVDDEVLVTLRAEDFLRLVTDNVKYIVPSKGEAKRSRSRIPALLRDDDDA